MPSLPSRGTLLAFALLSNAVCVSLSHGAQPAVPAKSAPSLPAPTSSVPTLAAPTMPVLSFDASDGSVIVAWYAAPGATGYQVARTTDTAMRPVTLATLSGTSLGYRDRKAVANTVYYYQVVAVAPNGSTAASPVAKFTPPASNSWLPTSTASQAGTPCGAVDAQATAAPKGWVAHVDFMFLTLVPDVAGACAITSSVLGVDLHVPSARLRTLTGAAYADEIAKSLFKIKRGVDASSPTLVSWSVDNQYFKTATLVFLATQAGHQVLLRQYTLTMGTISVVRRYTEPDPAGGTREVEELSLSYQKFALADAAGSGSVEVSVVPIG